MKLKKILLFLVLAFSIVACADSNMEPPFAGDFAKEEIALSEMEDMDYGGAENTAVSSDGMDREKSPQTNGGQELRLDRKIIYTGDLRMQVESIEATHKKILALLPKYSGYVSADNISNAYGWQENTMSLRVPREHFYDLLADVEAEAVTIDSKTVTAADVTEEYFDLKTHIATKKAAEAQYLEILKKAKSIAEILEVQSYLNNVRAEIERMEGRLKYLDNQTSFSTLTVTFWQDKEIEPKKTPSFWSKLGDGAGDGWDGVKVVLIGLVTFWPLWLLIIGVTLLIRWVVRKNNQKRTPPPAPKA